MTGVFRRLQEVRRLNRKIKTGEPLDPEDIALMKKAIESLTPEQRQFIIDRLVAKIKEQNHD